MVARAALASRSPLAVSVNHDPKHAPRLTVVSSGELSAARPFNMDGFRRTFPSKWADFLRAHFRDARHVAFAFSVDDKTARNWLAGITSPRAEVALYVVATHPGALSELMDGAA